MELVRTCDGHCYLAANYFRPESLCVLQQVLSRLVATPIAITTAPLLIPKAVSAKNITSFAHWDEAMENILSSLSQSQYEKLVLARRKQFHFHSAALLKPIDILNALQHQAEGNRRKNAAITYLFCLQIDHDVAFLGNTPERLFRTDGGEVLTEALAGTVRRENKGSEGELLSELLGAKNLQEHAFVVDYVTKALANCGLQIRSDGPHVKRLPRLMHLATQIRGDFTRELLEDREKDPRAIGRSVFRILRALHPTPAVCGVPTQRTISEISKLEAFDRGMFAGPLGWFSRGAGEFCVAIRSALVHGSKVTAYAGCGIVRGSESMSEWAESELKLSPFADLFGGNISNVSSLTARQTLEHNCSDNTNGVSLSDPSMLSNGSSSLIDVPADSSDAGKGSASSTISTGDHTGPLSSRVPSRVSSSESVPCLDLPLSKRTEQKPKVFFDPEKLESLPNLNTLWGCCCVEELCRNGVDTFFVSPGSRSTPLVVGVARSRYAKSFVAHDERGAAFLAVGYARSTGRAAAVITTSGTAVANLLPGVVEASIDNLPMILLTADRPPELRDSGANQSIDQVKIFSSYTKWTKDLPCPSEDVPLRNLLSDIDYAVHISGSSTSGKEERRGAGPVHLNMMFREKLAPSAQDWNRNYISAIGSRWTKSISPQTAYSYCSTHVSGNCRESSSGLNFRALESSIVNILDELKRSVAGLILVGGGTGAVRSEDDGLCLYEMSNLLGWPIISDVCGGLRFDASEQSCVIHYADQILTSPIGMKLMAVDAVVQIGERITSKRLNNLIKEASLSQDNFTHVLVSTSTRRCDHLFTVTHRIYGTIPDFLDGLQHMYSKSLKGVECESASGGKSGQKPRAGSRLMLAVELSKTVHTTLNGIFAHQYEQLTEPLFVRLLSEAITEPRGLFIGNSMPIRDLDAFGSSVNGGLKVRIAANRGASGIDGIISSGIGFGIGLNLDVVIVLGDMSFIHDINALHLLGANGVIPISITIVVVNNGGGGIFSLLPISRHSDVFSPFFDTPHAVEFRKVCEMFHVRYYSVRHAQELQQVLTKRTRRKEHAVIEVLVPKDHSSGSALRKRIGAAVAQQVSNFGRNQGI